MNRLILVLALLGATLAARAQTCRIAVLAPLYLDSIYDAGGNYKLGKSAPFASIPGLEFAEGARLALDTLQARGDSLHYILYDTRNLSLLLTEHELDSVQLIIGSVSGSDYQALAAFAKARNIPFVSATFPNEGGISDNPFTVILNPTIYTHCQAIYHFVLQNHPTHRILYVRKPGAMEDMLAGYFKQLNATAGKDSALLPIQTILTVDTVTAAQLQQYMDSDRYTVILCGSLDEGFGVSLVRACAGLADSYPMSLIGMPTWEGLRALQSPELRQMPFLVTTSFMAPQTDSNLAPLSMPQKFINLAHTHPGDMAFRGYESVYYFVNLLLKYHDGLMSHLDDKGFQTYTPLDIKPVFANSASRVPDYFENKFLYVLRLQNGFVTRLQ
jgi:hypothetical protein